MKKNEKLFLNQFKQLNELQQQSVMDFTFFLLSQQNNHEQGKIQVPQLIDKQADESVIAALKRLTATYPMINKNGVLDKATLLMSQHLLQGKEKIKVIGELESLFSEKYQQYCDEFYLDNTLEKK